MSEKLMDYEKMIRRKYIWMVNERKVVKYNSMNLSYPNSLNLSNQYLFLYWIQLILQLEVIIRWYGWNPDRRSFDEVKRKSNSDKIEGIFGIMELLWRINSR